jgi:chromate transport protein ChrA
MQVPTKTDLETGRISLPALAVEFLKIGASGFGGGMAIIALMEHELVKKRRVIPADEFAHGVALGQLLGPFSFNTALFKLGITFFTMGLVFFGGAFVLVPVLHQTLVVKLAWLSPQEFIDGVAISNLTPGPISVLATFAGYRLRGISGALVATGALYFPAIIVMLILCRQYERLKGRNETQTFLEGVIPAVVGLIASTGILLARETLHSWRAFVFAALALLLLSRWKLHPALILGVGAVAGTMRILP